MWTLRLPARSSDQRCLISGFCSSGRDFAPRFLQTVPRGSALALRSCFTSIRLHRGLSPPGCWTCPAHRTLRAGAWRRGRSRPPGQHLRAALCCKAGWGNERVKRRDLCSLRRGGRTIVGIEQHPPSEKDAGHSEQSVTDAPQGTAIGVPTRPEGLIAAAASAVVQHGYPRPVKHSVSQSDLEVCAEVGDGVRDEAAYRGGVRDL